MKENEEATISEIVQSIENEKKLSKNTKPAKEKKSHKGFFMFLFVAAVLIIGFMFLVSHAGIDSKNTQSLSQRIKYMKSIYKEPLLQLKK